MARYDHLPIYRSAMRLAVHLENTVRGFPRYVKYTLGSEMRQQSQRIIGLIIRANGERNRLHYKNIIPKNGGITNGTTHPHFVSHSAYLITIHV